MNTLTAWQAFQDLLVDAELKGPAISVRDGWKAFQTFLRLPADSLRDEAWFQTAWFRADRKLPLFQVRFCRRLGDDATGTGPVTRVVGLQFLLNRAPNHLKEVEASSFEFGGSDFGSAHFFSDDYVPSFEPLIQRIPRFPEFQYALDGELIRGEAMSYDGSLPGDP